MKSPLGTPRRLTFDYDGTNGWEPRPGDLLVSNGGSGYLIVAARRVDSTVHPRRWALDTVTHHTDAAARMRVEDDGGCVIDFRWHPRRPRQR